MAVEMPSQAPLVPPGSNSLDRSGGLAKLFFRLFTNLAKTLTVQCAANSACATSLAARRHVKRPPCFPHPASGRLVHG